MASVISGSTWTLMTFNNNKMIIITNLHKMKCWQGDNVVQPQSTTGEFTTSEHKYQEIYTRLGFHCWYATDICFTIEFCQISNIYHETLYVLYLWDLIHSPVWQRSEYMSFSSLLVAKKRTNNFYRSYRNVLRSWTSKLKALKAVHSWV